ncbi:Uu.00g048680.m01.CDS01 [Anthostomella pinea]|uniref:Uu.00g048680.m01.CDS01 n=1 Tax=Anthostomella pinea TaxID=933095 RepID=A0AAI8VCR5_9PEZI|nr:Uu.00g048680.m01.CDS01 [Anthostomella pinea]
MPSVTHSETPSLSSSGRKRRREDDGQMQMPLYGQSKTAASLTSSSANSSGLGPYSSTSQLNESQNLLSAFSSNERLIYPSNRGSAALYNMPRKVIPLSASKRFRLLDEDHDEPTQQQHLRHQHQHHHDEHHDAASPSPAAAMHQQQSYFSHAHPTPPISPHHLQNRPSASRANSSALLKPCHVCFRKPTKKSDLDSFADCMGCDRRTCFVCLRACQGWLPPAEERTGRREHNNNEEDLSASFTMHDVDDDVEYNSNNHTHQARDAQPPPDHARSKKGEGGGEAAGWRGHGHREVICSQCCVERGSEGEVVCLGCLDEVDGA